MTRVRLGQAPPKIDEAEFRKRYLARFDDPRFDAERAAIERLCAIAYDNYKDGRKAPKTRLAGPGFKDPSYELAVDWIDARDRILAAQTEQRDASKPSRVLVILGGGRNDGTCPSEASKTWRLAEIAKQTLEGEQHCEVDTLDLSLLASEHDLQIHPCKGCVSTAMPMCHWPCSCYPNHSLGQVNDAMNDIYERFVRAHGIMILTPVYWYQSPGGLKTMIDRLVCADGGNPDPSSTHGKKAEEAKELELANWPYPKHLAGRTFGVLVHGDAAGAEQLRRNLTDWLSATGLVAAGTSSLLDRYIGYYKPYATSHDDLDADADIQEEARNIARAIAQSTRLLRTGKRPEPDEGLGDPRPK